MNKIYLGNLPYRTTRSAILKAFSQFGEIEDLKLIKDRDTGRFRGFGFVTFTTNEAAKKALSMDGSQFQDRTIRVSIAKDKPDAKHSLWSKIKAMFTKRL